MIKRFVQGEDTDRELFCLLGPWLVSEAVHEKLGLAITGRAGDIWFVDIRKDRPVGFVQVRGLKNKKAHLRYAFAEEPRARLALIRAAITDAVRLDFISIFTNDWITDQTWRTTGFADCEKQKRGSFCRWERNLEISK